MTCASTLEAAAVGLLTGEDPGPEVRAHLDDCADCSAEVDRLRPLPALLADAAAEGVLDELPPPGEALLERLLAAAAQERASRRRRVFRAVAAVAAVLVLLVPAGVWLAQRGDGSPAGFHTTATDATTGVWADVRLTASDWGSDLSMAVSGVPKGTRCTLVVVTGDGQRQTAATWWASYSGTAQVEGNVAAGLSTIVRVEVVDDASGKPLLQVPVAT
jgi:hypothetical protein